MIPAHGLITPISTPTGRSMMACGFRTVFIAVVVLSLLCDDCSAALQSTALQATWDFSGASSKASVIVQVSSNPFAALFNPKASSAPKVSHPDAHHNIQPTNTCMHVLHPDARHNIQPTNTCMHVLHPDAHHNIQPTNTCMHACPSNKLEPYVNHGHHAVMSSMVFAATCGYYISTTKGSLQQLDSS